MGWLDRSGLTAALFLLGAMGSPPALAQMSDRHWPVCSADQSGPYSFAQRVAACSAVLESKQVTVEGRANTLAMRSLAYAGLRDFDHAFADANEAFRLSPGNPLAFACRGYVNFLKGDPKAAIADYDEALRRAPSAIYVLRDRAEAKASLKDYAGALPDYDAIIKLLPDSAWAYRSRGMTYLWLNNNDAALPDLNKAIKLEPGYMGAYILRGSAYGGQDNLTAAIADYDKAWRLDPKNALAVNMRCLTWALIGGDIERALSDCNKMIEKVDKANLASVGAGRGALLLRLGRFEEALTYLDAAVAAIDDYDEALYMRGIVKLRLGRINEGRADIEAADKLNPLVAPRYAQHGIAP